ncbi:unnamed protein product [Mytilus edulis]|uniref:Uncharacterized protein n=1 Tax=Mytilus edulis TaxID=6550 RepID=A0A8S3RIN8_MYTED|nr:unnamed protein product [Mytilus edulis]
MEELNKRNKDVVCKKRKLIEISSDEDDKKDDTPLTIIYENETPTTTPLQTITDPIWSKGSVIPVRVATKRREELHPQWPSKTAKYEQISPVKNNLYDFSEEKMGAFSSNVMMLNVSIEWETEDTKEDTIDDSPISLCEEVNKLRARLYHLEAMLIAHVCEWKC